MRSATFDSRFKLFYAREVLHCSPSEALRRIPEQAEWELIKAEWKVYHEEIEERRKNGGKGKRRRGKHGKPKGATPDDFDDDEGA